MTLTIHEIAYKKMIYHCLCYPSSKVYGKNVSYVGALIEGDKEEMIVDAYPLFHTPLLAPSLSIAMDLIESNLSENQKICGFYEFVEESECLMNRIIEGNQQLTKMKLIKVTSKNSTFDVSM